MKTLIINPPCEFGLDRNGRWPARVRGGTIIEPLFLAYAAAVLEKDGLDIELIDCPPLRISRQELLKRINDKVGFLVVQTAALSLKEDMETVRQIKNKFPEIKTILVGPHVTVLDREIMQEQDFIDFIARGEYDYIIRDLVKALIEGKDPINVAGITFRKNKGIIQNPARPHIENLDELPFPARHFLPMERYFEPVFKSRRTFRIFSSRGCPSRCIFCLWPQTMFGRKVRLRNPKKVVDEIECLIEVHQAKGILFDDDTFTVSQNHVKGICDEILKRKIKIPWSCLGRVDNINEEILEKMKAAGCTMIRYGIESACQEILDRAKKGITVERIVKTVELTKKFGIETYADYLLGLPGETKETLEKTINFALKLDTDYAQFPIVIPYPGTELYQEAVNRGWLKFNDWADFEASKTSVLEYPDLKAADIAEMAKKAYRRFYLRPDYIIKRAVKIRSFQEIIQLVKGAANVAKSSFFN